MNFISGDDVQRLIREKIVMPPSVTRCTVPQGIFKEADGAMIQFIAYGDELNIVYPARPKDPVWAVKVRRKSTSMLPLMEMKGMPSGKDRGDMETTPQPKQREEGITPGKLLKGIFGL